MTGVRVDAAVLDALDRRFRETRDLVPILRQRAGAEAVDRVRAIEDLVPLLFPHTVYKSYPAALVDQGRWTQMNRWLDSMSARRVDVDVAGVVDVDGWLDRLATAGHYVAASSGTTGKSSFLNKSCADLDAAVEGNLAALAGGGVLPDHSWHLVRLSARSGNIVGRRMQAALVEGMARPDTVPPFPAPAQTEGHHAYMARLTALRRAMVDGTARPDEIAATEAEAARRGAETEDVLAYWIDHIFERPDERFLFGTMMALAWRLVAGMRDRGARAGDLTGDNAVFMAGGTKGVVLPPDADAQLQAMLNVSPSRFVQLYSMQEINIGMPRCTHGRYHVPRGLLLIVLDDPGEALAQISDSQAEGRAAFFDFSVAGRWGGTISGDRIRADFAGCPCGGGGPTVFGDIARYANGTDDDKITCAGTMDAYVRGIIDDS